MTKKNPWVIVEDIKATEGGFIKGLDWWAKYLNTTAFKVTRNLLDGTWLIKKDGGK